ALGTDARRLQRAGARAADPVGLAEFARLAAVELPYGRKRALEIATTLALDPEMMLLDEPTAGMAHDDVARISALIRTAAVNRTGLMVEHNLSVVENLSDVITVLSRGEVLAEGDYARVSRHPDVIQAYLGRGTEARATPSRLRFWSRPAAGRAWSSRLVRGIPCVARRGFRGSSRRGGDPPGTQRGGEDHHAQVDHGDRRPSPGLGEIRGPGADRSPVE